MTGPQQHFIHPCSACDQASIPQKFSKHYSILSHNQVSLTADIGESPLNDRLQLTKSDQIKGLKHPGMSRLLDEICSCLLYFAALLL